MAQVEDHQEAVVMQNPYSASQILSIAHNLVKDTGFDDEGCKEWKRRPINEKTRPKFKLFLFERIQGELAIEGKGKDGGICK